MSSATRSATMAALIPAPMIARSASMTLAMVQLASMGGGVREDVRAAHATVEGLPNDRHRRETHARFDARLDALEVAFEKVNRRLLAIGRVVRPPPAPDN